MFTLSQALYLPYIYVILTAASRCVCYYYLHFTGETGAHGDFNTHLSLQFGEDSSWPHFWVWWIESWLPVQSLAVDLSLCHLVPLSLAGIFCSKLVLGLLLVPGLSYDMGTSPSNLKSSSSGPHAAMSVPRVIPFLTLSA